jgi:beta-glucosidase/6-phospho-beta-glucosidase/beta-galactosidase
MACAAAYATQAKGADQGIVLYFTPAYPASNTPEDAAAATRFDGSFNRWFIRPTL